MAGIATTSASATQVLKSKYIIDKLNGTNYQVWKIRMELYLKQLQLWDIINSNDRVEPQSPEWKAQDTSAQMELILHCNDRQVQMVRTLKSAREIWLFFEKSYQHTDLVYQVSLIKRLVNTYMSEGQSRCHVLGELASSS